MLAVDGQGLGRATGVYSHNGPGHSWSGEVKASRSLGDHSRVFAMVRGRLHTADIPTADLFDVGPIDIRYPTPATPAPVAGPAVRTLDEAAQITAGFGVETRLWDRLQLRAAVQRTRYEKTVTPPGEPCGPERDHAVALRRLGGVRPVADLDAVRHRLARAGGDRQGARQRRQRRRDPAGGHLQAVRTGRAGADHAQAVADRLGLPDLQADAGLRRGQCLPAAVSGTAPGAGAVADRPGRPAPDGGAGGGGAAAARSRDPW